jgi:hypothetical protein
MNPSFGPDSASERIFQETTATILTGYAFIGNPIKPRKPRG